MVVSKSKRDIDVDPHNYQGDSLIMVGDIRGCDVVF